MDPPNVYTSNTPSASSCKKSDKMSEGYADTRTLDAKLADEEEIAVKEFFIFPVPKRLQYRATKPFKYSYPLVIFFSLSATILSANLYYCQPILIAMAYSFNVSHEQVARIPMLVQVGYALGLVVILPFGDLFRRRQLILLTTFITAVLSIGLALAQKVAVFEAITFLTGFANVSAQLLVPLVAESAPLEKRAFAYSLMLVGIMFGILSARVVAGIIGEFFSWRIVYYSAVILQSTVLIGLYFVLPDYPSPNSGIPYWKMHLSMIKLAVTEPIVVQAVLVNLGTSACFAYYWVTLTFLLGGPPYGYSTLDIGLFGLLGMAGVAAGPMSGRIVDKIHPWHALLISTIILTLFQAIQTFAGGLHIAAVIISCFGLDFFQQIQGIALVVSIFSVSRTAISRLNAIYILSFYIGQLAGTFVGTRIFIRFGWRAAGGFGMALYAFQLAALLIRGPHCKQYTWFGYEGGLSLRRKEVDANTVSNSESEVTNAA